MARESDQGHPDLAIFFPRSRLTKRPKNMYVILCQRNGQVFLVTDGEGDNPSAATFATEAEAEAAALDVPICRVARYIIVEAP